MGVEKADVFDVVAVTFYFTLDVKAVFVSETGNGLSGFVPFAIRVVHPLSSVVAHASAVAHVFSEVFSKRVQSF